MRLRQIILNLLSNALKFTDKGKVVISVRLLAQENEKLVIEFKITDSGIGIPAVKLNNIFNNFEQAFEQTSSLYGGTGLGLAISKQLVERQGGSISVKSEMGKGSVFSFTLAFDEANTETTTAVESTNDAPHALKDVSVLVAEDLPLNQLLLKIILGDLGFEIDIVGNGKLAVEKLASVIKEAQDSSVANNTAGKRSRAYDVILMDLQMPEMNGFEATTYIRNKMKSQIPIIALTADVTTVDVEKCLAAGMDDYISKPIDEDLLLSKIVKVLRNKREA